MDYTVNTRGDRSFSVINERGQPVGNMEYTGWWGVNKAQADTLDGNVYRIERIGFWMQTVAVYRNDVPYLTMKAHLGLGLDIFFENGINLKYKKKSVLHTEEQLTDGEGNVVARMYSWFKFAKFNFHYEITVHAPPKDRDAERFLPFLLIYCCKFLRMRRAA